MNQIIFEYITKNPVLIAGISIITSFLVWLYRDSKSKIENNDDDRLQTIEASLSSLYQLESLISFCTHKIKDSKLDQDVHLELYQKLGECNTFLNDENRKVVLDFYKDNDYKKVKRIKSIVQAKIEDLRKEKKDLLLNNSTEFSIFYIVRMLRPLKFIFAVMFFFTYILVCVSIIYFQKTLEAKLLALISAFSIFFSIFILYLLLSVGRKRKLLKIKDPQILAFIIACVTPLIILIKAELAYISMPIQAGLFYYIDRKERQIHNNEVTTL